MEDAATAEISRSQVWQQIKNGVVLSDTGETVTELVARILDEEAEVVRELGARRAVRAFYLPAEQLIADLVPVRRLHRLLDPARVRAGP